MALRWLGHNPDYRPVRNVCEKDHTEPGLHVPDSIRLSRNELRGACWDIELVIPRMKPCGLSSYPGTEFLGTSLRQAPVELWRPRPCNHPLENGTWEGPHPDPRKESHRRRCPDEREAVWEPNPGTRDSKHRSARLLRKVAGQHLQLATVANRPPAPDLRCEPLAVPSCCESAIGPG